MQYQLNVGDKIPSFTLKDQEGASIDSEDFIGSPVVIYFYPKDDTPGCTLEACSFRDSMEDFDSIDAIVIGISPDDSASHTKFSDKHDLNFTLLCDENMEIARKFGAVKESENGGKKPLSIVRSTYVVDSTGVIRWIEKPVSVEGHAERVLEALHQI